MFSFHFLEIQKRIEEELAARVSRIFYHFNPVIIMGVGWQVLYPEAYSEPCQIFANSILPHDSGGMS